MSDFQSGGYGDLSVSLLFLMFMMFLVGQPFVFVVIILFIRVLIGVMMVDLEGNSWFRLVFVILYFGGVLVIFVYLVSMLPNEVGGKGMWLVGSLVIPALLLSSILIDGNVFSVGGGLICVSLSSFIWLLLLVILVLIFVLIYLRFFLKNFPQSLRLS